MLLKVHQGAASEVPEINYEWLVSKHQAEKRSEEIHLPGLITVGNIAVELSLNQKRGRSYAPPPPR